MEQQRILVMYSGGLDSLGTVYKLLTDAEYKDYKVHIHHVHNKNIENRARAEAIVVKAAIKELNNLGFKFDYSESEIGVPSYNGKFMWDTDSMNFFAGYICSVVPNITKVAMGMNANDDNQRLSERRVRANAILAAFTTAEKIYPVLNLTKKQIHDMLPVSLKNVFWSCRTPKYTETSIEPCKNCKPCVQLREQGIR